MNWRDEFHEPGEGNQCKEFVVIAGARFEA
jgi:hypothetical protein